MKVIMSFCKCPIGNKAHVKPEEDKETEQLFQINTK